MAKVYMESSKRSYVRNYLFKCDIIYKLILKFITSVKSSLYNCHALCHASVLTISLDSNMREETFGLVLANYKYSGVFFFGGGGGIRRGSPNIWRGFGFKIASIRCVLNFSVHAKSLAQRKQARIY